MTKTPTVTLASSGAAMPLLGFGTWQLTGHKAYDSVRHALDVGYRHIDTATGYGNEAQVGRAIHDSGVPRDELFVTTKLPPDRAGKERRTLEASLHDLGLLYVDLWLIHWPPRGSSVPVWRAFRELRDEGLTRSIGVSNFDAHRIDSLIEETGEAPAVNQIPWSPFDYSVEEVDELRRRGVVLEGYSPLKRSDLYATALVEIARAHGVTPAQVVLRWHIEHGFVVIPKSANPARIEANFDIFSFTLAKDELARIDALA